LLLTRIIFHSIEHLRHYSKLRNAWKLVNAPYPLWHLWAPVRLSITVHQLFVTPMCFDYFQRVKPSGGSRPAHSPLRNTDERTFFSFIIVDYYTTDAPFPISCFTTKCIAFRIPFSVTVTRAILALVTGQVRLVCISLNIHSLMHMAADRSHNLEVKVINWIISIYSQHFRINNDHTL